jgi:hypothetical protein
MAPSTQILLSGALTFGVPLALAVRDLMTMRRSPPGPGWRPDPVPPKPPQPIDGSGPALPACLLDAAKGYGASRKLLELERV